MPTKQKRPKRRKEVKRRREPLRDEDGQLLVPGQRKVYGKCFFCERNALRRKSRTPIEINGKLVRGVLVCLRHNMRVSRNRSGENLVRKLSKADVTLGLALDQSGRSIGEICEAVNRQRAKRGEPEVSRLTICRRSVPSSKIYTGSYTQEP